MKTFENFNTETYFESILNRNFDIYFDLINYDATYYFYEKKYLFSIDKKYNKLFIRKKILDDMSKDYNDRIENFGIMRRCIKEKMNIKIIQIFLLEDMNTNLYEKYFNIISTGDSISIKYNECNLIKQYPELIEKMILPITENLVKTQTHSLFDFIINTLNINFHPDDNFEDYLVSNSIVDIDNKILEFDEASLKYIQAQIGLCFEYLEDDIYQIGFDILKPRLDPSKN